MKNQWNVKAEVVMPDARCVSITAVIHAQTRANAEIVFETNALVEEWYVLSVSIEPAFEPVALV
mgnify:CR=1 FL=1